MSDVPTVTDATFDAEVLQSPLPVLVDFFATWCGPCKRLAPTVAEIAREHAGKVKVVSIDIDGNPDSAVRFGVTAVPTLVFFKGGKEAGRLLGAVSKEKITDPLSRLLTP
jgi:thioredoxin 1